jgi:Ca-activated chloride channel family protein
MRILWPGFLLLLGLIPTLIAVYIWMLRRRRRFVVRYSSLALLRDALPRQSHLRRHLPFALFLLGLASLVVALGRPAAIVQVPAGRATIILAIDVSRSMCATDIRPNRLEAAKVAALSFIQRQEPSTQIGIVAFAGFAELVQAPTNDQEALQIAVEGLNTARRTAIGSGILKSLDSIAEVDPDVAPVSSDSSSGVGSEPLPEGTYVPHIVVLLTDGVSNAGPEPLDAAQLAVERGIRVYTIGFGTENENVSIPFCDRRFQGGDLFGGGQDFGGGWGFGGGRFRRGIDERALKQVSEMTGAEYYSATSAGELQRVFRDLPTTFITREETMEISVAFTAIGALLAALAIGLAMLWNPLF